MVLRYYGRWVKTDKEKWKALTFKEKNKMHRKLFCRTG